ncbi:pimeloyl-ACP methyl ester carboxylesterase [Streptacidiphilus sp. MAP12-20]|uniref:alpha/beta fold hydrolase n=1 Tax=Streptacidiphilus sp. MAP12-20 TaxID=3156299 RepID=UPI0035121B48
MTEIAYFESQDGPLAYIDAGPRDGRALVLLHSVFVDGTQFDNLIPGLVAAGYRVIAPDARGHGRSANASRPFRQADDLADLLRHLGLDQVVLVGVSMGALIGVDAAVEYPELVRALVVSGRGLCEPDLSDAWSARVAARQGAAMASGDLAGYLDGFLEWIAGPERGLDEVDPAIVAQVREMALRTLMKHTPDEPDHRVPVEELATRAKEIAVPVLAVNGALDAPGLLATADDLIRTVPNGRTVLLEGVGHYTTMEAPAEFARVLEGFLGEVYSA